MRRRRASSSPPPLSISWLNLFASLSFISIYIIASQTQGLLTIQAPKSLPILHNLNIFYLNILPLFLSKLSKPSVCLPHSSLFLSKLNKALSVSSRFLPSDLCLSLSQFEPIVAFVPSSANRRDIDDLSSSPLHASITQVWLSLSQKFFFFLFISFDKSQLIF